MLSNLFFRQLLKRITFLKQCNASFNRKYCKTIRPLEPVIGLEIHAQISTASKLFSAAKASYAAPQNSLVAFLDAALPGTLPRLNRECVVAGVKTALALKCQVNEVSKFDRKHYFYADLPAGYQITQQREPLARAGHVSYSLAVKSPHGVEQTEHTARIIQIQLEQDSGKSLHDEDGMSLVDLNRAGTALMEIVTEPDFHSAEQAGAFVKELRNILLVLGTCQCKMEEGNLRVDASISLHKPGTPLGTRTEVKNLNSFKHISSAIDYEIRRQRNILEKGGTVESETMTFDVKSNKTVPMRDKENVHDYRFMPEPNLPPLRLFRNETLPQGAAKSDSQIINIDDVMSGLPQLPCEQRDRLNQVYGVQPKQAAYFAENIGMVSFFDEVYRLSESKDVALICISTQFLHLLFLGNNFTFINSPIAPSDVAGLLHMVSTDKITISTAKKIMKKMCLEKISSINTIIEELNCWKITDPLETRHCCEKVVKEYVQQSTGSKRKKKSKNDSTKLFSLVKESVSGRIDDDKIRVMIQTLLEEMNDF